MGIVSDDQAGSLGGADKKAGAHGKDTHQMTNERHIVVIARYKPPAGPFGAAGMANASGLIGSVTGAIEKGVSAAESAMNSIPGLQMFIKEDKKESPSEKEYKYSYAAWDSKVPEIDKNIKKIFPDNKVLEVFDFDAADADGRKQAAQKLYNGKLKSALSGFANYPVRLHLIGIGQGGNVMNEVSELLSKDAQFKSEDWLVKSMFYIGTPVYAALHKFNEACLKSDGQVFQVKCSLDLTQQVTDFFTPSDDFLKFIVNSNSNTVSLAVGKIKLSIVKILSLFLESSSISIGDPHGFDKFGNIKPEIENLVKQMTGMIKQVVSEIAAFIDPGKLPEFSEAMNGLDQVPSKSIDRFSTFVSDLADNMKDQAKHIVSGGGMLGPQDLMGAFNCFCPLFEQVTKAISVLDYNTPATVALANQMIENAGITEVYAKGDMEGTAIDLNGVIADYLKERLETYQKEGKVDKINKLIGDVSDLLQEFDGGIVKVKDLNDEKKIQLAAAVYSIVQPMLVSKKRVLEELQKWIAKLNIEELLKDISANKLLGMANPLLAKLNLQFQQPLKDSINDTDSQLNRLKGFFKPRDYDLHKDTLYFIFNVHNQVINSFFEEVGYLLDKQTGFIDYMHHRGCENQFTVTQKNTYNPAAEKDPGENMVTTKIPEEAAA